MWDPTQPIYENIIPEWGKLRINEETNELNSDMHYGRYGNYYLALIIKTIIENPIVDYRMDDYYMMSKIKEAIKNNPPNFQKVEEWDAQTEMVSSKRQIFKNVT
jgi:hypothetical protein